MFSSRTMILSTVLFPLVLIGFVGTRCNSQVLNRFWTANGDVQAIARYGDTLYIGGQFGHVAPNTGGGAQLDVVSGDILPPYLEIGGYVSAVASDGEGGWFIGGSFTSVGGLVRNRLAHVLADGSVSPWNPNANQWVREVTVSGSIVYVGGTFASIGGVARNRIAAIDSETGELTPWNPGEFGTTNGDVHSIFVTDEAIYVGGLFTSIGGASRYRLAALDPATGEPLAWNPNPNEEAEPYFTVGSSICVGGIFTSIGGEVRNHLAMIDRATGLATDWDPDVNRSVFDVALGDSTIYVGGDFSAIGGQARSCLAEVSLSTGLPTAWNPDVTQPSWPDVRAIVSDGSTIYIGGTFTTVGGQPRQNLAAIDAVSGIPTDWAPVSGSSVLCMDRQSDVLFAGGLSFGGADRLNLAALDITTGELTDWDPHV
ncbi:MAG: hypothetical protein KC729_04855, partial [Candidatus Eisenbacteria bacterium]|nr:hypothetical protein [Candidatus Eisenbacteria bacterium]